MIFKHTEHTKQYFSECKSLLNNFSQFKWNSVKTFNMNLTKGNIGETMLGTEHHVNYKFLKFSAKQFEHIENTEDENINYFLKDSNILSVGKITLGCHSNIGLHKDHDYWSKPFYRIHIPLNSPGTLFLYDEQKIIWKKNEVYIFDVMNVIHGAENNTDQDFEMVFVDITQQNNEQEQSQNTNLKHFQKLFLETYSSDFILGAYKQGCTEDELNAINTYLKEYKGTIEKG